MRSDRGPRFPAGLRYQDGPTRPCKEQSCSLGPGLFNAFLDTARCRRALGIEKPSSGSFLRPDRIGLEEAELIEVMQYVRSWQTLSPIHYGTMSLLVPQTLH